MSQKNVEIVREMIDRFNRDGFLPEDLFDPDVELFNARESPLPGPYHGYEGLRQWREGVFEVVEEGQFEIDELRDVDEADRHLQDSPPGSRQAHPSRDRHRLDQRELVFVKVGSTAPCPSRAKRKPSKPPGLERVAYLPSRASPNRRRARAGARSRPRGRAQIFSRTIVLRAKRIPKTTVQRSRFRSTRDPPRRSSPTGRCRTPRIGPRPCPSAGGRGRSGPPR